MLLRTLLMICLVSTTSLNAQDEPTDQPQVAAPTQSPEVSEAPPRFYFGAHVPPLFTFNASYGASAAIAITETIWIEAEWMNYAILLDRKGNQANVATVRGKFFLDDTPMYLNIGIASGKKAVNESGYCVKTGATQTCYPGFSGSYRFLGIDVGFGGRVQLDNGLVIGVDIANAVIPFKYQEEPSLDEGTFDSATIAQSNSDMKQYKRIPIRWTVISLGYQL